MTDPDLDELPPDVFIAWCIDELGQFLAQAQAAGTTLQTLEWGSVAAQASGIAVAPWPRITVDGKSVSQYYCILYNKTFEPWPASDGQGLTMSLDGQVFLRGKVSTLADAAAFMGHALGYSRATAKKILADALADEVRPMW